jgi:uncharacterized membrane protein
MTTDWQEIAAGLMLAVGTGALAFNQAVAHPVAWIAAVAAGTMLMGAKLSRSGASGDKKAAAAADKPVAGTLLQTGGPSLADVVGEVRAVGQVVAALAPAAAVEPGALPLAAASASPSGSGVTSAVLAEVAPVLAEVAADAPVTEGSDVP